MGFALKLRQRSLKEEAEGFFIAQQWTVDYARNPRQKILDYIKESGKRLAVDYNICNKDLVPQEFYVEPDSNQPVIPSSQEDYDGLEKVGPLTADELIEYI